MNKHSLPPEVPNHRLTRSVVKEDRGPLTVGQFILPISFSLLVAAIVWMALMIFEQREVRNEMESQLREMTEIRSQIEGDINQVARGAQVLGSLLRARGGIDDPQAIRTVGMDLLRENPSVRSFTLAPDNVVALQIPERGNEAMMGVDLTKISGQGDRARQVMETRESLLAGPYELVQGGMALIYRRPVFTHNGDQLDQYWGQISTPISLDALLISSGAMRYIDAGEMAIRRIDGYEWSTGNTALFQQPGVVKETVTALDSQFEIAMAPRVELSLTSAISPMMAVVVGFAALWVFWRTWRRQKKVRAIRKSEKLLNEIMVHMRDIVLRVDANGVIELVNPAFADVTERPGQKIIGTGWLDLLVDDDREQVQARVEQIINDSREHNEPEQYELSFMIVGAQEQIFPVRARITEVRNHYKEHDGFILLLEDQTEQIKQERAHHLASAVFESTSDAIVFTDRDRQILAVNPAFERMVGQSRAQLLHTQLEQPRPVDKARGQMIRAMREVIKMGHWRGAVKSIMPDGSTRVLQWNIDAIFNEQGRIVRFAAVIGDVTERYNTLKRVEHMAMHDQLTGIFNRVGFDEHVQQAMVDGRRHGTDIAVALIDLDGFKPINDQFGHKAGDNVLKAIASRLAEQGRETDIAARLGGDEFVVVFTDLKNPDDLPALAERLLARIALPVEIAAGAQVQVGASIGMAYTPVHGDTIDKLLEVADKSMYSAKDAGKGRFVIAAV